MAKVQINLCVAGKYSEVEEYYKGEVVETDDGLFVAKIFVRTHTEPKKENDAFFSNIGLSYELIEKLKGL